MKKTFKEYHQFSEAEFKQLWKDCLFVFDTNTLLNMYRYSRKTVDTYFNVLNELKTKKQLWIPYQVGYEFYENRIDVIAEYESSYESILTILNKAKSDIDAKYKDHPFLDLNEIKKQIESGLSSVDKEIKKAQGEHPKWMNSDDVLNRINDLFENSTGNNYSEERLEVIKKEGEHRYEKKIPPGFKDNKKTDDKKYGDLILWLQIIDKAIESKKPIVLISGDVKEDWWLEKNGNRLMPLPQLKKEMLDKAKVDFHIYTADRFLEYYTQNETRSTTESIDKTTINEVRKIRELEERRMMRKRIEMIEREFSPRDLERDLIRDSLPHLHHQLEVMNDLMLAISQEEINIRHKDDLEKLLNGIKESRNRIAHGRGSRIISLRLDEQIQGFLFVLTKILRSGELNPELETKVHDTIDRLEHLNHRMRKFS